MFARHSTAKSKHLFWANGRTPFDMDLSTCFVLRKGFASPSGVLAIWPAIFGYLWLRKVYAKAKLPATDENAESGSEVCRRSAKASIDWAGNQGMNELEHSPCFAWSGGTVYQAPKGRRGQATEGKP